MEAYAYMCVRLFLVGYGWLMLEDREPAMLIKYREPI